MIELIEAGDRDFLWLLGGEPHTRGLRLPPGGVDAPSMLAVVRRMAAALRAVHGRGAWMMVEDGEVVGLCCYLRPPNAKGEVTFGYGIAPSRRGDGHPTGIMAAMLAMAAEDPKANAVVAVTAIADGATQGELDRNGFVEAGRGVHPQMGEVISWRRALR
ncbi:MAG TPA: GNAT family protein [Rhizomicrobium sp.]